MNPEVEQRVGHYRDDIKLLDFWYAARQHWRIVVAVPAALILATAIFLHVAKHSYTVSLSVTPVTPSSNSALSGLSGLGSLAGLALGPNPTDIPFSLYLAGLHSRGAAQALVAQDELIRKMYSNEWDEASDTWKEPRSVTATVKNLIKSVLGIPVLDWMPPNGPRVQEFLELNIVITKERDSPIVTVSIDVLDPELGIEVLDALHAIVDNNLRQRSLERSEAYIAYLKDQLEATKVAEYRTALVSTLAEQEKARMMASSELSFAAEPFGEPAASIRPTSPRGTLLLVLAAIFGLVGGILAALMLYRNRDDNS